MAAQTNRMPFDASTEANTVAYMFRQMLKLCDFIKLVQVQSVDADEGTCQVIPLVIDESPEGAQVSPQSVYDIPYFRLQMGSSAVVMDPAEGDIGILMVCDENTAGVIAAGGAAVAPTGQRNSRQFGIYLGGVALLNNTPTEYIKFTGSGIEMSSDNYVKISCGDEVLELATSGLTHNGVNIGSTHTHGKVQNGTDVSGVPQ